MAELSQPPLYFFSRVSNCEVSKGSANINSKQKLQFPLLRRRAMANEGVEPMLELSARQPRAWMKSVISVLDAAIGELARQGNPAERTVLEAASLLREQINPQDPRTVARSGGGLLDTCLTDIALQCVFADQAHFCRRFRDATGESPAAWRRARPGGTLETTTVDAWTRAYA
jgi:AraC-like DNA-binding protein